MMPILPGRTTPEISDKKTEEKPQQAAPTVAPVAPPIANEKYEETKTEEPTLTPEQQKPRQQETPAPVVASPEKEKKRLPPVDANESFLNNNKANKDDDTAVEDEDLDNLSFEEGSISFNDTPPPYENQDTDNTPHLKADNDEAFNRPIGSFPAEDRSRQSVLSSLNNKSGDEKGRIKKILAIVFLIIIFTGLGYWLWQSDLFISSGEGTQTTTVEETSPSSTSSGKVADRLLPDGKGEVAEERPQPEESLTPIAESPTVPSPAAEAPAVETSQPEETAQNEPSATPESSASAPTTEAPVLPSAENGNVAVAQTAILYEAPTAENEQGLRADGGVIWSLDTAGEGPVIRGRIEVPGRGLTVSLSISRNRDEALPATHLLEFEFETKENFPGGGIAGFAGVVMKTQEEARGDALRGATANVGEGLFWQALSSQEEYEKTNIELLRDRGWIDVLVLFGNKQRAILTLEKGTPGEAIFDKAFAAWGK
jgi:hypothetical protein